MQVYREIPVISNQARRRKALISGLISASEEWTVARHRQMVRGIVDRQNGPCVLDAGTGMYLNAILLNFPLNRRVPEELRREARDLTRDAANPRREARRRELALAGEREGGSVWDGELVYHTKLVYLRPDRELLDARIRRRSHDISTSARALHEAETLIEMSRNGNPPNPSVRDSIGVKEMVDHALGRISLEEAEQRIYTRTRKLARRQMRWFDKLAKTLEGRAGFTLIKHPGEITNCMHDIIRT